MLLATTLVLAGCGQQGTPPSNASTQDSSTASEVAAPTVVLKIASVSAPDSVIVQSLNKLKDDVAAKSNGSIDIRVFPSSQLGNQDETTEGVAMGTIEMCVNASAAFEAFDDQFSIYGIPFLFENDDHVYNFYKSDLSKKMLDSFSETNNMKCLAFFNEGFRTVWSVDPIGTLDDFKGYKLRVPNVPAYIDMFTALGCNAIPLAMGDIYTGLQTGTVEGLEFPISAVLQNKLAEIVKYQTITNHTGSMQFLFINDDIYNSMTPEQQEILVSCAADAEAYGLQLFTESKQQFTKEAEEMGVQTIVLPADELAKIQAKMEPIVKKYTENKFSDDYIAQVKAMAN
jgi:tripartite ATP-independent transporter DctP family solute receptor